MNVSYTWIFTLSAILHVVLTIAVLAIVWVGWKRTRQIGYLVLVAWALIELFNSVGPWLWFDAGQQLLGKLFPSARGPLLMILRVVSSGVSHLVLLVGLALLVFGLPATKTGRE